MIEFRKAEPSRDPEIARWLRWLDAETFPGDVPFEFPLASWFIGWNDNRAIAYCGWKPVMHGSNVVGFHYRAGVLRDWRGKKLQRRMLTLREREMRRQSIATAVTYTDTHNAASMRNLIAAGYLPYRETKETNLADGRQGFVHWRKDL